MSTNYSLYQSSVGSHDVVIIHNKTQLGWRCPLYAVVDQLMHTIPHGWSLRNNTSRLGPLLAHFDALEDLYANYPELSI